MRGARLAEEARAKDVEHAIGLHELAPERIRGSRIVACMHAILLERDRAFDLHRHGPDTHVDIERTERAHHGRVELRGRHGAERDALLAGIAGVQDELVGAEIEIDLQRAVAIGHRAGREPARADDRARCPTSGSSSGASASFTLPTTCVHRCSVLQVSAQSS